MLNWAWLQFWLGSTLTSYISLCPVEWTVVERMVIAWCIEINFKKHLISGSQSDFAKAREIFLML